MKDQNTDLLIKIASDLATNTQATKGIESHLDRLNSKVAKHSDRLNNHTKILLIVGTALGVVLILNGSELVGFIASIL